MKNFCLFVCPHQLFLSSVQKNAIFQKTMLFLKIQNKRKSRPFLLKRLQFFFIIFFQILLRGCCSCCCCSSSYFQGLGLQRTDAGLYKTFQQRRRSGRAFHTQKNVGCVDAKYYYFHSFLCERTKTRESFDVTESCFLEQQQRML